MEGKFNIPEAKVNNNPAEGVDDIHNNPAEGVDDIQKGVDDIQMRKNETKKAREALTKFTHYSPVENGVQAAKDFIGNQYELTQKNISNVVRAIGSGLAILHDINPEFINGEKWIKRFNAAEGMMRAAKEKLLQNYPKEVQIALAETKKCLYNRQDGEALFFRWPDYLLERRYKEALRTLEEFQATDLIKQLINELQEDIASGKIDVVEYVRDTRLLDGRYTSRLENRPKIAQHQIEVLQNLLKKIEERQQGQVKKTV